MLVNQPGDMRQNPSYMEDIHREHYHRMLLILRIFEFFDQTGSCKRPEPGLPLSSPSRQFANAILANAASISRRSTERREEAPKGCDGNLRSLWTEFEYSDTV